MEHYALLQPGPALPAPPGTRLILVRTAQVGETWTTAYDLLRVVAIQPTVAHHYVGEAVAPVHPDPGLMAAHGWTYRHLEMRYAPVFITPEGRLATIDPADPRAFLVDADTPDDRIAIIAETLKAREVERQLAERAIEEAEAGGHEVEGD